MIVIFNSFHALFLFASVWKLGSIQRLFNNENIYFAIGIKLICLVLGAIGIANMWVAIFADVGVMVIAVINAIRALFVKNL